MTLLSRRAAIASVPVGAAAAHALLRREEAHDPAAPAPDGASAGPSVLTHLAPGSRVGPWTVTAASVQAGAVVVALRDAQGETCELDLHARDEQPGAVLPPASTRSLAIFVRNGGSGRTDTHEDHGLAALTLAERLSHVEGAGFSDSLSTLAERELHPSVSRA